MFIEVVLRDLSTQGSQSLSHQVWDFNGPPLPPLFLKPFLTALVRSGKTPL